MSVKPKVWKSKSDFNSNKNIGATKGDDGYNCPVSNIMTTCRCQHKTADGTTGVGIYDG
jgi:hypothetical protein